MSHYSPHKDVHASKPLGEFSIKNYNLLRVTNKVNYEITLSTTQKLCKFACENDKERTEWMDAFEKVGNDKFMNSMIDPQMQEMDSNVINL